ncbi:MAG: glycosyltransferase [Desulfamplus sp.]|nr:glycosyltransferase [Desulfamplus sp.]
MGRVSEDKGVGCIIEAFLLIADKIPGYHLVIVGKLDTSSPKGITFTDQLKTMINQSRYKNFIHFTGFKENTWPYYRAFDCNILASKEVEGVSQSLLEAMYAKCPVAGSKVGGTSDIIRHDETGLLFRPDQSEELAQYILNIINDKDATKKRVISAFQMVQDKYTIDSMVSRILDIYHKDIHQ